MVVSFSQGLYYVPLCSWLLTILVWIIKLKMVEEDEFFCVGLYCRAETVLSLYLDSEILPMTKVLPQFHFTLALQANLAIQ